MQKLIITTEQIYVILLNLSAYLFRCIIEVCLAAHLQMLTQFLAQLI